MKIANVLNPIYVYKKREWILPNIRRIAAPALGRLDRGLSRLDEARRRLGIPLTSNHLRLRSLKDAHRGRRAFVIGNGPSLRVEDLDRLGRGGEISFAANKIYLAYGSTPWRPTFYLAIDALGLTDPRFYEQDSGPSRFLVTQDIAARMEPGRIANEVIVYRELKPMEWTLDGSPELPSFSDDAFRGLFYGSTVTYMAIQFAAYMGINEVYLLGVDANYNPIRGVIKGGVRLESDGTEKNHFHPDYHPPGSLTYPGEIELQMKSYRRASEYARERGSSFRIFNATRGGMLEVFPRVDFDSLF